MSKMGLIFYFIIAIIGTTIIMINLISMTLTDTDNITDVQWIIPVLFVIWGDFGIKLWKE